LQESPAGGGGGFVKGKVSNCEPTSTMGKKVKSKLGGTIVNGSITTPLIGLGAGVGALVGGPPGAFAGGIIGSMFGGGVSASYVPSTGSLYVGPTVTAGLGLMGGGGMSATITPIPSSQNANQIAGGQGYSITYQPSPALGSTVTKSPGSGPPVVGVSVGSRIPVSVAAAFGLCIYHCGC